MTQSQQINPTAPLAGRHAVVTGANGGIGKAICISLAAKGAHITLMGRNLPALQETLSELSGSQHGIALADVSHHEQVTGAIGKARDERGQVSICICNAGAGTSAPFVHTKLQLWQQMLDINLTGTFNTISASIPDMIASGWGRVINVASTAGLKGYGYVTAYCAAKHGVVGLTRALAIELAQSGVTVNAVCPGFTDTPLLAVAIDNIVEKTGMTIEQAKTKLASTNPQGRLIMPEEVANTVEWLCLPASQSIHGQCIAIAGGEVM